MPYGNDASHPHPDIGLVLGKVKPEQLEGALLIRAVGKDEVMSAQEKATKLAAQIWCQPSTEHLALDVKLTETVEQAVLPLFETLEWLKTDMCFKAPEQMADCVPGWVEKIEEALGVKG